MSDEDGTMLSSLPPGVTGAPPPGGGAPAAPVAPLPAPEAEAPKKPEPVDLAELEPFLADAYADGIEVVGQFVLGTRVAFPEARAARRGRQLAKLLQKLGWADEEIILIATFAAGVASDVGALWALKQQVDKARAQEVAKAEERAAAADSSPPVVAEA